MRFIDTKFIVELYAQTANIKGRIISANMLGGYRTDKI